MIKSSEDLSKAILLAAHEKKSKDLVRMDMRKVTTATDYFVIASGNSTIQTRAIADEIEEALEKQGIRFLRKEGYRTGEWILLDYGDCVAHIFTKESRNYYALEQLWNNAELTAYDEEELEQLEETMKD